MRSHAPRCCSIVSRPGDYAISTKHHDSSKSQHSGCCDFFYRKELWVRNLNVKAMKTICFSLAAIVLVACHTRNKELPQVRAMMMDMAAPRIEESPVRRAPSNGSDRDLIREAHLVMEVG